MLMLLAAVAAGAALCLAFIWPLLSDAREQRDEAIESMESYAEVARLSSASWSLAVGRLNAQQEKSNALESRLRRALSRDPDCSLGGDVGGVLRDAVPPVAGAAAADQGRPEAADPAVGGGAGVVEVDGRPVSCHAVALWAVRNIAISKENSLLLEEAVEQYELNRASRVK